jgi:NADH-quinone oxidoreductase subunit M
MFQRVFMGPLDKPANEKLNDLNRRELVIMLSFILFIFWIGIAPSGWFGLMDSSVGNLVSDISNAISNNLTSLPLP